MAGAVAAPARKLKKNRRKVAVRSSTRKVVAAPESAPKSRHWRHDAFALFFSAAALYLLAASLLFHARALSGGAAPSTLIGRVGEQIARVLETGMGYSSILVVLWCCGYAAYFWTKKSDADEDEAKGSWIGYLLSMAGFFIAACCLAWLAGGENAGGFLGELFMRLPVSRLGGLGAGILAFGLCLFCLARASRHSVPELLRKGALLIKTGSLKSGRAIVGGGRVSGILIQKIGDTLLERRSEGRSILEVDPVWDKQLGPEEEKKAARRKKAALKALEKEPPLVDEDEYEEDDEDYDDAWVEEYDEEDFDDEDDFMAREEAATHVVVKRRDTAKDAPQKPRPVAPAYRIADYKFPETSILTLSGPSESSQDDEELLAISKQIERKLLDFSVMGHVTEVHPGPVVTLFEFEPAPGVKVGKIASLQDDLAMSLKSTSVRIVAPIPRKGTVGIEVPNKHRDIVRLGDLVTCDAFVDAESILTVPIGKDTYGDPVVADIATMPHLLMAGATGTGKSVLINTLLVSLLYRATPQELGLILIDPKVLELSVYDGIPHLRVPVVTVPKQAKAVLDWAVREMERRYRLMQRFGVRSIDGYNKLCKGEVELEKRPRTEGIIPLDEDEIVQEGTAIPETEDGPKRTVVGERLEPLPKIVIVIDELADLMLTVGREIEELITRLAQKARAAGLHLIVATQRPSVDVITGLIKANFPARLSFRVASRIDSRTILDSMGSEKLLGKGDMLFMLPGGVGLKRVHGAFVSDTEVTKVIAAVKRNGPPVYDDRIMEICEKALSESNSDGSSGGGQDDEYDAFYDKAVELVIEKGQASTSMVQRAFRIGYNRAARIIERMEQEGVIGPMDGVKPREVIVPSRTRT